MVAGAGAQVNWCGDIRVFQDAFVEAAVGVGGVSSDVSGVGEAGEVLLGFLVGGAEAVVALIHDRVLVGVLGRIGVKHRADGGDSIPCVFVPLSFVVQRRLGEELEELVAGGVGPLLFGQCNETSGKRS